MTQEQLSQAKNKDLPASLIAIRRAARMAREQAVRTDTSIVIYRDGRIVHISAAELREEGVR
jgi:hypothetical protein